MATNTMLTENDASMYCTREERLRRCGVDCADSVLWKHWSVGGEYPNKLIIKNTHDKLQVLEYKLPQRKATFFVDFPSPVSLSSGMAYELEIKFRPSELVEFHDYIEISVKGRGSFRIRLDALTPFAKLNAPEKHDFEFCAVGATATSDMTLANKGTIPLDFYWDVPEPFEIVPRVGSLSENQSVVVQAKFTPKEATSMLCRAVCRQSGTNDLLAITKMSGIGKYAFVNFKDPSNSVLDFGEVLTNSTSQRVITVINKSAVHAQFNIKRTDRDIVCPFVISPMKGVVPRDGQVRITVRYTPTGSGAHMANDFVLQTVGGNQLKIGCRGASIGPTAVLSTSKLEFGDVNLDELVASPGSSTTVAANQAKLDRFVILKNTTNTPIRYQFVGTNPGAAFVVTPFSGQIAAKGTQNIKISFSPKLPLNYLRRLFVLINDTEQALFIDVLGTAYNTKTRPAPFTATEARAFFARIEAGLGRCAPDDIAKLIEGIRNNSPVASDDDLAARQAMLLVLSEKEATAGGAGKTPGLNGTKRKKTEHLNKILPDEDTATTSPFTLDRSYVTFRGFSSEGEVVSIRNNTSAKATANWAVPADTHWSVTPEVQDIAPFASANFRVRLVGNPPGSSLGNFLECFVNFKQMRSFRLVSEDTFCPPHCLLLQCQRLVSLSDTAGTPQVETPAQVAFPPCHEKDAVLQVVSVTNHSDTVAAFSMQLEAQQVGPRSTIHSTDPDQDELAHQRTLSRVFTCFPSTGVVPPKETILLLMKFSPPSTTRFVGVAKLLINDSPQGSKQIALRGEGFSPMLELEANGVLSFRPTSVGGTTSRTYTISNPSRIPVRFELTIPQNAQDIIRVSPSSGVLPGCGSLALDCQFSPQQGRRYDAKVHFHVRAENPPQGLEETSPTRIVCQASGEGMFGVVSVEPLDMKYGSVLVGGSHTEQLTVFNSSLCDLQYEVRWMVRHSHGASAAPSPPEFINGKGVIRARSHVNAHVTLQPVRGYFEYVLYVIVGGSEEIYSAPEPSLDDIARLPNCCITVTGAFPSLQVTDVRSVLQPKSHLWRQMSIGAVNETLAADINAIDSRNDGFSFDQAIEGLTPIHCELGVDVFRTTPLRIMARLDNYGSCVAKFKIWFPHETEIPKEPWHNEKLQNESIAEVIDANLFDVSPRSGSVQPNGHVIISLTYKHTRVGQHELPVLLQLDQGKKVLLNLTARTLAENASFLYFHHSMTHDLAPVAIGDLEPPLQYTELQNLSHQPIYYAIDETPLNALREANYDFPIFQCLNPQGLIPPMSTLLLSWYFRPLEAKRYDVPIPVTVEGGETYTILLGGQGYHPKKVTNAEVKKLQEKDFLPLPKFPTLKHPLLPVRLSMDVLRFGSIPFHSLHRQIVNIHNEHRTDTFLFEWHCVLQYGDQIFDIEPPRGRIGPGEKVTCRITMYSGSTSHIIDNPIYCHVLNEDLKNRRDEKRNRAEKAAAMELEAAPSSDNEGGQPKSDTRKRGTGGAKPRLRQPVSTVPAKFQNTARLREAIQSITEQVVAEELDENSDDLVYLEVLPTILELVVQARIMPIELHESIYGEAASRALFFPTLSAFSTTLPSNSVDLGGATEEEWTLVHNILEDVMKEVVHHARIEDAFTDTSEDPVPYFCEIAEQQEERENTRRASAYFSSRTGVEDEAAEVPQTLSTSINGDLQCLIEEVLEGAIHGIIGEAHQDDGVITAVAMKRARSILVHPHPPSQETVTIKNRPALNQRSGGV